MFSVTDAVILLHKSNGTSAQGTAPVETNVSQALQSPLLSVASAAESDILEGLLRLDLLTGPARKNAGTALRVRAIRDVLAAESTFNGDPLLKELEYIVAVAADAARHLTCAPRRMRQCGGTARDRLP